MGKKILLIASCVVVALLLSIGAYAYYLYHSVEKTADQMYEPIDHSDEDKDKDTPEASESEDGDPISILLMGVDERPNDPGRSDTLIVMTLNPEDESMQMVSIPRDTRTDIAGKGTTDKINHAYAFGGTKMSMDTVENFLDIDLDHYIKINMQGLSKLVDAVGGITVQNDTVSWKDKGFNYHKGKLDLDNGKKALGYVRMRHQDSKGDFGRNQRQRDVIKAVVDKAASFSSISRYSHILEAIGGNVKTDLTFGQMKEIALHDRGARHNVDNYEVKGEGKRIKNIYYLQVSDEEKEKVHEMITRQQATSQREKASNNSAGKPDQEENAS